MRSTIRAPCSVDIGAQKYLDQVAGNGGVQVDVAPHLLRELVPRHALQPGDSVVALPEQGRDFPGDKVHDSRVNGIEIDVQLSPDALGVDERPQKRGDQNERNCNDRQQQRQYDGESVHLAEFSLQAAECMTGRQSSSLCMVVRTLPDTALLCTG